MNALGITLLSLRNKIEASRNQWLAQIKYTEQSISNLRKQFDDLWFWQFSESNKILDQINILEQVRDSSREHMAIYERALGLKGPTTDAEMIAVIEEIIANQELHERAALHLNGVEDFTKSQRLKRQADLIRQRALK